MGAKAHGFLSTKVFADDTVGKSVSDSGRPGVNGCENLRIDGAKGPDAGAIAVAYDPHIVSALSGGLGTSPTHFCPCPCTSLSFLIADSASATRLPG
jgi:hypothetical protein